MGALQTLPNDASTNAILQALDRDGACIIANVLGRDALERIDAEIAPFIATAATGRDDFTGRQTARIGALVARSAACRDVVMHAQILAAANAFLKPYCNRIQLHLTQLIRILPGQGAQPLHRDRLAWGGFLPYPIEPQFNTLWALTDFTCENGATRVVPGSHRANPSSDKLSPEPPPESEVMQAAMARGSVLIYSGSVVHGGGQNRSDSPRLGMNITYCLSWLRQEENQFLSCPPEIARTLQPELQELLGYTMANYALGYYSSPQPLDADVTDTMAPEMALGRRPRANLKFSGFG